MSEERGSSSKKSASKVKKSGHGTKSSQSSERHSPVSLKSIKRKYEVELVSKGKKLTVNSKSAVSSVFETKISDLCHMAPSHNVSQK